MIAHVAVFTFDSEMTEERAGALAEELRAMAASLPSIKRYAAGPNLRMRPGGADFAVIALVEDQAGIDAYLDSPDHVDLVAKSIAPFLVQRQAVQLEVPEDWAPLWAEGQP
ncbi:Dabb family protein [Lacisediminihabitans profunda]|uniref:Dabb family protein n=1 Tax=Lacisediminihabitans profunda TaxID=2594790 RepID=A0A5C8ULZ5_9MICO|nr:Dabb family protein [Lacisediminihabitans profunda]TXN29372.1 Dabb family protein [Lacisediminihabitans profunda]